jgi:hypothetical protein
MSIVIPSLRAAVAVPGWAKNELWRRARAVPSLDLRFADNKSLVDAVTGASLVTFTRASNGMFTNSAGVLQTAATNLVLRSEEFDDASWTKENASITTNTTTAPDGTITADTYSGTSTSGIRQSVTLTSGTVYTISFYVKSAGLGNNGFRLIIDGTKPSSNFTATSNWQRFTFTATSANTGPRTCGIIRNSLNAAIDVFIWGAQVEQSSTVGEYIPTTSTINSAPRFDHNPTTGESLGLLVEEQRTNLCLQSEDFSTTWSTNGTTVTVNSIASPAGATTADALFETSDTSEHRIRQNFTGLTADTNYTISVYVKDLGGRNLSIRVLDTDNTDNGYLANFSPLSGTVVTAATSIGSGVAASTSITALLGGWHRVTLTGNAGATCTKYILDFFSLSGTTISFAGDTGKGLYLWGAQLEAGAFPTSYIPTTTAAVTRSADVASITGSAFSSWANNNQGTIFSDSLVIASGIKTQGVWSLSGGLISTNLRQPHSTSTTFRAVIGGVFTPNTGSTLSSSVTRAAVAYSGTEGRLQVGSASSDVTGSANDATEMGVGQLGILSGNSPLNGTIRRLTFWGQRLPNNILQAITQ